jgi:hypothetical protein
LNDKLFRLVMGDVDVVVLVFGKKELSSEDCQACIIRHQDQVAQVQLQKRDSNLIKQLVNYGVVTP